MATLLASRPIARLRPRALQAKPPVFARFPMVAAQVCVQLPNSGARIGASHPAVGV